MSYLRAYLVRRLTWGFESEDWHWKFSTAQLWRWHEDARRRAEAFQ
ncbi:hypothetical protein ACWD7M_16965 [Streptomyces griseus]